MLSISLLEQKNQEMCCELKRTNQTMSYFLFWKDDRVVTLSKEHNLQQKIS